MRAAGDSLIIWLLNVLNSVVELEAVPDILKKGILVPMYKRGGKDPLQANNSVLSPALFVLVMDPLLRQLQASGLGLSISNFYVGGFLHADDVRTLATSRVSPEVQATMVEEFVSRLSELECR